MTCRSFCAVTQTQKVAKVLIPNRFHTPTYIFNRKHVFPLSLNSKASANFVNPSCAPSSLRFYAPSSTILKFCRFFFLYIFRHFGKKKAVYTRSHTYTWSIYIYTGLLCNALIFFALTCHFVPLPFLLLLLFPFVISPPIHRDVYLTFLHSLDKLVTAPHFSTFVLLHIHTRT